MEWVIGLVCLGLIVAAVLGFQGGHLQRPGPGA
jgi:hypothetical protein